MDPAAAYVKRKCSRCICMIRGVLYISLFEYTVNKGTVPLKRVARELRVDGKRIGVVTPRREPEIFASRLYKNVHGLSLHRAGI